MVSSRTAAGNTRSKTYLSLALGTAYIVVQFERLANWYPCKRKLPDGRVLDHINTLNLFDG